ncbi:MAG: protein BatD [Gammaproteobacteria bacterium]|nr:protein BatD [Gammaproteobacteria bacterium]
MVNLLQTLSQSSTCRLRVMALLALLSWAGMATAAITVEVDPDPPREGESFRLAFSFEGDISEAPDFSVLQEGFEILARNERNAVSIVNGKYTRKTTWVLEVLPRGTGPVKIPSVQIGGAHSKAFTLHARPDSTATGEEVEAEPSTPYVQQEVRYTVRLWRRYELSNASLSEPQLSVDALVKPLQGDRQFVQERNGRRYDVVERSYLIYPQESGELTIQPVRVTAQVLERAASLFEMLGRAVKTRRVDSPPVTLTVRPVPQTFPAGAHWLPARRVRLNELWAPESGPVRVGEPLSRTLSLWASGVTSGQLPTLVSGTIAGLRQYPDQPQLQDTLQAGEQHAVRQEKTAFVADRAGAHEIPALVIPWWNTDTDALEYAELPSRRMEVDVQPTSDTPTPQALPANAPDSAAASAAAPAPAALPAWRDWPGWFDVALFAVLGWLTTTFWLLKRTPGAAARVMPGADAPTHMSASQALALARAACAADDAAAAQKALLAWAAEVWTVNPPQTLEALARRVEAPLAAALSGLDRACHGPTTGRWQGATLAEALNACEKLDPDAHLSRPAATDSLPRLFRLSGARRV